MMIPYDITILPLETILPVYSTETINYKDSVLLVKNQTQHIELPSATVEGKQKIKLHQEKERDPFFMKRCKEYYSNQDPNLSCAVCGFSFIKRYGEIGRNFIEGHHEKPISELTEETIMKVSDIRMVCSNCHSMIHTRTPCYTVDELKKLLIHNQ